jgi:hypothetical protein
MPRSISSLSQWIAEYCALALYSRSDVGGGRARRAVSELRLLNCQSSVTSPATWGGSRNLGTADTRSGLV